MLQRIRNLFAGRKQNLPEAIATSVEARDLLVNNAIPKEVTQLLEALYSLEATYVPNSNLATTKAYTNEYLKIQHSHQDLGFFARQRQRQTDQLELIHKITRAVQLLAVREADVEYNTLTSSLGIARAIPDHIKNVLIIQFAYVKIMTAYCTFNNNPQKLYTQIADYKLQLINNIHALSEEHRNVKRAEKALANNLQFLQENVIMQKIFLAPKQMYSNLERFAAMAWYKLFVAETNLTTGWVLVILAAMFGAITGPTLHGADNVLYTASMSLAGAYVVAIPTFTAFNLTQANNKYLQGLKELQPEISPLDLAYIIKMDKKLGIDVNAITIPSLINETEQAIHHTTETARESLEVYSAVNASFAAAKTSFVNLVLLTSLLIIPIVLAAGYSGSLLLLVTVPALSVGILGALAVYSAKMRTYNNPTDRWSKVLNFVVNVLSAPLNTLNGFRYISAAYKSFQAKRELKAHFKTISNVIHRNVNEIARIDPNIAKIQQFWAQKIAKLNAKIAACSAFDALETLAALKNECSSIKEDIENFKSNLDLMQAIEKAQSDVEAARADTTENSRVSLDSCETNLKNKIKQAEEQQIVGKCMTHLLTIYHMQRSSYIENAKQFHAHSTERLLEEPESVTPEEASIEMFTPPPQVALDLYKAPIEKQNIDTLLEIRQAISIKCNNLH